MLLRLAALPILSPPPVLPNTLPPLTLSLTLTLTLRTDAKVYISCGERFRDPFGDPVPWTRVDDQGAHTTARDYKHPITKSDQNVRVQAVRNGDAYAVSAIVVAETGTARKEGTFNMDDAMRKLLADATAKLRLPSAAAIAYNEVGEEITSTRDLTKDQVVYISCGEPFRDPYDTMPWREEHKVWPVKRSEWEGGLVGGGIKRGDFPGSVTPLPALGRVDRSGQVRSICISPYLVLTPQS